MRARRRRIVGSLFAAGIAWAAMLGGGGASALGPRVVLVGAEEGDATLIRMRDELRVLGIHVEVIKAPEGPRDLVHIGRELRADAVARVEPWPPEVLIWVRPSDAGEVGGEREIRVGGGLAESEPGLLALRAIELLRGRLIPIPGELHPAGGADAASPITPAATPPLRASDTLAATPSPRAAALAATASREGATVGEAATPGRLSIVAGPALLTGPGGVPPAVQIRLGVGWSLSERLGLVATALVPTAPASVSAPEGALGLRVGALVAGAQVDLTDRRSTVHVSADAGIGAMLLVFEGDAASPWESRGGSRWAAFPYARAGAGYRVHPAARLRADVTAGLVRPEPVLRIAGREVAAFGQPAVLLGVALEVAP